MKWMIVTPLIYLVIAVGVWVHLFCASFAESKNNNRTYKHNDDWTIQKHWSYHASDIWFYSVSWPAILVINIVGWIVTGFVLGMIMIIEPIYNYFYKPKG